MDNLFSTHPATENRIAALEQLAREMGQSARPQGSFASRSHYAGSTPPDGPWGQGAQGDQGPQGPWGGGARRNSPWG